MEIFPLLRSLLTLEAAATGLLLLAASVATRFVLWVWWTPRSIEKRLRSQGLGVNPYTFLFGDSKERMRLSIEAQATPMPRGSHDLAPHVLPFYDNMRRKFGNMFCIWSGPTPKVVVSDPDLVKDIVSNKLGDFGKPHVRKLARIIITGLLSYNGEKWAKHRKIINPSFHFDKLKRMLPTFYGCTKAMVDKWEKLFESGSDSVELDVFPELQNLIVGVISQTAFGSSHQDGYRIFQLQDEQSRLVAGAFRYSMIPGYRFLPTEANRRMWKNEREVRAILGGLIDKREKEMKAGVVSDDLLGYLLESNMRELQESGNNRKATMTREEVIEECKIFYFAGQDTTGTMLNWTMILLGMHPAWQERAREEVLEVFGRNQPDFDGLSRLKIVTMILYEVLRLYPPVVFVQRCTEGETTVGDFRLPAGTDVFLSVLFLHHDPEFWGADALEFNPERFANGISKASRNGRAFYPFGGGPRICIGQNFAMMEGKLAMALILQRFSFELSSSYVHAPHSILTLQPKLGAQIVLKRLP